ncbi:MAG: SDR family NAD(P)-dependent oxidoreductase [Burkholderiaceae bacterium]|nr:SDR family NAD(P)-dependent oxidoreductase [Microbacteriaceae bacterium]
MTVLISGCGDLGTEVGLRFAALGHRVIGVRRSADLLPAPIEGQAVDLRVARPVVPADTDIVVVAIAASAPTPEEYRAAYVDGLANTLVGVDESGATPRRIILVSSTAVYDVHDGSWVDERSPADSAAPNARILAEAEQLVAARPGAVVLRLAGIYGPGRDRLIGQVRSGAATVGPGSPHTNRIHRDDAAAAIVHLALIDAQPAPVYIGVDSSPSRRSDVVRFLAGELGVELDEQPADVAPTGQTSEDRRGGDKRCSNALLLSTGFAFTYPDFRAGYRSMLAGVGTRHP